MVRERVGQKRNEIRLCQRDGHYVGHAVLCQKLIVASAKNGRRQTREAWHRILQGNRKTDEKFITSCTHLSSNGR